VFDGSSSRGRPVPGSITAYLVADHERLHGLLTRAMANPPAVDAAAFAAFRSGLLRHIAIEEQVLFPALGRAWASRARTRDLHADHGVLASLLVPTPDFALCGELATFLGRHDRNEEGPSGVYAACEAQLSPDARRTLGRAAAGFRTVRVAPHFDGHGVHRTAAAALASGRRAEAPAKVPPT
jgi:hypothetical protein